MDDKEVVENNSDYVIEFKDKYKGKFHYSKKGEWILEKINKEPNKLCINNYALNNDPVFTAVISERSIPEEIKLKNSIDPSYNPKFSSYFPLWQLSKDRPKDQISKSSMRHDNSNQSSLVAFPEVKAPFIQREEIIASLHNRIREKRIKKLYTKLNKVFSLTREIKV